MDAEARKIRRFVNEALVGAHQNAKHIIPSFFDFKKKLKKNVSNVEIGSNEKGERMITISMGTGGKIKVEIISSGIEEDEALSQLKELMLEIALDKVI